MNNWENKININNVFVMQPTRPVTYFGVGAIQKINDILQTLKEKGMSRILVVSGRKAYKATGAWDTVEPALNKYAECWNHYDKVRPNPTYDNCEEAAAAALEMGADCLLAIGGGSPLDTAKTAAILMKHPGKKAIQFYEQGEPITGAAPMIAINTSHGTGSECNSFAVAQSDGEDKPAISSPYIYPMYTIEDPALTTSMPTNQTLATSIDTINHSLEAATTVCTNPYSVSLAKQAIYYVASCLPKAIVEPDNLTARYYLMYASALAGISFDLGFLHLTHSMEHAMSALNPKVTHGDGLGILMSAMVREIYPAVPETLATILEPIVPGLQGIPSEARACAEGLKEWCLGVGQKTSMAGYFTESDIPELVKHTMNGALPKQLLKLAPVPATAQVVERIFRSSL